MIASPTASIKHNRAERFLVAAMQRAVNFLMPPRCPVCGQTVAGYDGLCALCWREVDFITEPFAEQTGQPLAYPLLDSGQNASPPAYDKARAVMNYRSEASRALIARFKYGDRTEIALLAARWMLRAGKPLVAEADVIVPVPLHRRRLLRRRFNQAAEMARHLARLGGRPACPDMLIRRRATVSQTGLTRSARRRNVAGAFIVNPARRPLVKGQKILLVDDVMTSGATVQACARCLLRAGAVCVSVLTLARVSQPADGRQTAYNSPPYRKLGKTAPITG